MQDKLLGFEIYFYCNLYGRVVNSQGKVYPKVTLEVLPKADERCGPVRNKIAETLSRVRRLVRLKTEGKRKILNGWITSMNLLSLLVQSIPDAPFDAYPLGK
jgi:hypothetical protein